MARALLFVGHGGVPSDYPRRELAELKRLEGERRRTGSPITPEEAALDVKIRAWPRTPETDPYLAGFDSLAEALRQRVAYPVLTAYNEFCAPTIEEAVASAHAAGISELMVLTTMVTPGGSHAAVEIPEVLATCRTRYPNMTITYAWPFAAQSVATFFACHVESSWPTPQRGD